MSKRVSVGDVTDKILQSVLASPTRQRRLLSQTLWGKFGFEVRTKGRIQTVADALQRASLKVSVENYQFGKEPDRVRVTLTYDGKDAPVTALITTPPASWFHQMAQLEFESEREVEYHFISALFEKLGYETADFAIGLTIKGKKVRGAKKPDEADVVLFNGKNHEPETCLVIVEAKKADAKKKTLLEEATYQARQYTYWLTPVYYIVTDGYEFRVFENLGGLTPDRSLLSFRREALKQNWDKLYQILNRSTVVAVKEKRNRAANPPSVDFNLLPRDTQTAAQTVNRPSE